MSEPIRTARPDDIAAIEAIETESFSNPWSGEDFRRELENSWARLWVLESGGEIAAYLLAWFLTPTVELHKIAAARRCRRRGLAASLMARLVSEARAEGADSVWLEVRASNREAVGLYERFGFRLAHRRPDYYERPREDALVFRLDLKGEKS